MTTFLTQRQHPPVPTASTAVLSIDCMPRHLRMTVETLMVDCLTSESELAIAGADPLTAAWFTAWQPSTVQPRSVRCRQVLTGTAEELALFDASLNQLAHEHGFFAGLSLVD